MDIGDRQRLERIIQKHEGYPEKLDVGSLLLFQILREIEKDIYKGLQRGIPLRNFKNSFINRCSQVQKLY